MNEFQPIHVQRQSKTAINEFFVFGERNSGTNYVDALLRNNFAKLSNSSNDLISEKGFRFGWKHGFPTLLSAPDFVLAVVVFRDPNTWVQSMKRTPWHVPKSIADLEFSQFIRHPWKSHINEVNFGLSGKSDPRALTELQWDRHPITGQAFDNIFQLRRTKNEGFLSYKNRFSNVVLVNYEQVKKSEDGFIDLISNTFSLDRKSNLHTIETARGRKSQGTFKPTNYKPLSKKDSDFMWDQLDATQEKGLGYSEP